MVIKHLCDKCVNQVSQHKNVVTTAACNQLLLVMQLLIITTHSCMYTVSQKTCASVIF